MKNKIRIHINAPLTITFSLICVITLILGYITKGVSNSTLFSVYRSSLIDPLTYVRFITHIFGHYNIEHLLNNLLFILVLGPTLEEKYGYKTMIVCILITALATGILQWLLFVDTRLLGASGIVFMMIILSSFTKAKEGSIPLTFILVFVLFVGSEIYQGIFIKDNISQFAHIIGGFCGGLLGVKLNGIKFN